MFYSAETGGFYSTQIHGKKMPLDVVEITPAQHKALLDGQASGKRITSDNRGRPVLADPLPPGVPKSVTRFQALAALHYAGHLPAVEAIMEAPETPVIAKLAWKNALSFERKSDLLNSLGATLGLTEADLDALFTAAATIEA